MNKFRQENLHSELEGKRTTLLMIYKAVYLRLRIRQPSFEPNFTFQRPDMKYP